MTLTEINFYAKKMAPFAVIVLLVLLTLYFGIRLLILVLQPTTSGPVTQSASPIALNILFQKIKTPQITSFQSSGTFTYTIDTLDGTINSEIATSAARVFFLPKSTPSFGFINQIYAMAKSGGIDTELTKHHVKDRIAEFADGKRTLRINIDTYNFNYDYTITPEDEKFDSAYMPSESQIDAQATQFLDKMKKYPRELAQGKRNYIYLKYDDASKQIAPLDSPIGANMVEVDLFWPNEQNMPIVSSSFYNSPNYVVLGYGKSGAHVIRAQTRIFDRSKDQIGLYPVRSSEDAWKALQNGRGMVVSSDRKEGKVTIKKVFLAYYDPDIYQEYVQPVYVFLGDQKFVAYVPAVTDEYLIQ